MKYLGQYSLNREFTCFLFKRENLQTFDPKNSTQHALTRQSWFGTVYHLTHIQRGLNLTTPVSWTHVSNMSRGLDSYMAQQKFNEGTSHSRRRRYSMAHALKHTSYHRSVKHIKLSFTKSHVRITVMVHHVPIKHFKTTTRPTPQK